MEISLAVPASEAFRDSLLSRALQGGLVLRGLEHQLTQLATKHHTSTHSLLPTPGQGREEGNKALLVKIRRVDLNNTKREKTIRKTSE